MSKNKARILSVVGVMLLGSFMVAYIDLSWGVSYSGFGVAIVHKTALMVMGAWIGFLARG